jgi:hypothetical protein
MAVPLALGLAGRPRVAIASAAVETALLGRRLGSFRARPYRLAGELVARGLLATALGFSCAVRRAWSPLLLLVAIRRPGARRLLLAAFATPLIQDALATRAPRAVLADVPIRLLDEVVAVVGRWEGCIRHRTSGPLLAAWSRARSAGATGRSDRAGRL